MENKEMILDELTNFEKRKPKEIPHILEEYLIRIAKTGDTMFPWIKLKPLFMCKMERVISEFNEMSPAEDVAQCPNVERFKYELMKEKLLQAIDNFCSSAPFTIQRLCELITTPRKHYKHTDKFMRGLEKNVLVVSTVEPGCSHIFACDCARKRADHQNSTMMNGIIDAPNAFNGVDMYSAMYAEEEREQLLSTSDDELNSNDVGNAECPASTSPLPNVSNDETTEEHRKTSSSDENYKSKSLDSYPPADEPELETPFPPAIISTSPPPTLEASTVSFATNNKNGTAESPRVEDAGDKEEEYNSDDTVSSSTQYSGENKRDSIAKITKVTSLDDKNETDTKPESDLVTGNDSSDDTKESDVTTDKTDEGIGSSSQIALRECDDEKVPDNELSNKEKAAEEKCDESVETSSIEESDEASSSQYVRSPTFGKSANSEVPMEKNLEEEQPSSSDIGTDDSSCKTVTDTAIEANEEETPVTTMTDANEEEAMCSNSEDMTVSSEVISEVNDASPCSAFSPTESQPESLLSSSSTSSSSSSSSSSFPSQTTPLQNTTSILTEQNVSSEETVLEDVTFSNINASEDAEMLPVEDMPEPMEED